MLKLEFWTNKNAILGIFLKEKRFKKYIKLLKKNNIEYTKIKEYQLLKTKNRIICAKTWGYDLKIFNQLLKVANFLDKNFKIYLPSKEAPLIIECEGNDDKIYFALAPCFEPEGYDIYFKEENNE